MTPYPKGLTVRAKHEVLLSRRLKSRLIYDEHGALEVADGVTTGLQCHDARGRSTHIRFRNKAVYLTDREFTILDTEDNRALLVEAALCRP